MKIKHEGIGVYNTDATKYMVENINKIYIVSLRPIVLLQEFYSTLVYAIVSIIVGIFYFCDYVVFFKHQSF